MCARPNFVFKIELSSFSDPRNLVRQARLDLAAKVKEGRAEENGEQGLF